ncbi:MAG: hypothetical protein B7C55_08255 [Actinomycetales bacterium mxb001]|nr:MAG: hypothetical protein B7C55_08255 [Actinomycetales bacterium mxb001]
MPNVGSDQGGQPGPNALNGIGAGTGGTGGGTNAPGSTGTSGAVLVFLDLGSSPSAPGSVTATPNSSTGAAQVSFSTVSAYPSVSSYSATCSSSDGGATRSASGLSSPISVANLTRGKNYVCSVAATNDLGSASASSSSFLMPGAPQNTTPPSFTGTAGFPAFKSPPEVLTGNPGVWNTFGLPDDTYAYLWQSQAGCAGGRTPASRLPNNQLNFTITANDVNNCLRLQVTGSNASNPSWGSNVAVSASSLQVTTQPAFTAQSPPVIADVGYFSGYSFAASGNRITYSIDNSAPLTGLPPGMSINGTTGALTGTPNPGTAGPWTYAVIATNASGTVSSTPKLLTVSDSVVDRLVITEQPVGGRSRLAAL